MSEIDNKVIWIIGGSGGIGSNIARRMSNNGWKVIISARDIEKLNLVSNGKSIESLIVDATNADDVQEKAKEINEKYGSLDAVVNSVGSIFLRPLHATSSEQFMDTINQNLVTSFNVIRATAKIMMRGNGGRIVLFSSAAASLGMPNHAAISAAKAGVEGLARAAASDCAAPGTSAAESCARPRRAALLCTRPTARAAGRAPRAASRSGSHLASPCA